MQRSFVLPLYPLEGFVLLPCMHVEVTPIGRVANELIRRASQYDHTLVASYFEDDAVHEVGVKAKVVPASEEKPGAVFRALSRCRLRELVDEDIPMVRAEDFPDAPRSPSRQESLRRLLLRRFSRLWWYKDPELCSTLRNLQLDFLTWHLVPHLALKLDQQQGLLNLPDPVVRGQVLLLAIKDLERRERFLRPYARLRHGGTWN